MLLNLVYLLALLILSPWLVWRAFATGRYRSELAAKLFGHVRLFNPHTKQVAWFHAVSVGEVNLLGTLVPAFRKRHPDWLVVVSSTTDTGLAEARKKFPDLDVIAWPFDFTWAVSTALDAAKPALVVLTESELWPNFLAAASKRNIPVVVVNARMSPRSFARMKRIAGAARRLLFRHVTRFAVQETEYAERLRLLGVPSTKLHVTGSIKYDGAAVPNEAKTRALRASLGISEPNPPTPFPCREGGEKPSSLQGKGVGGLGSSLILLAGSTHAPEESIILRVFARLLTRFPHLRLILVPRHPDRFEEVARLVEQSGLPFVRRSQIGVPLPEMPAVVVLDTVGELGAAWGLADVGFTGGSLDGGRGGQSMIEPAGYGIPCVFGPHVWNFWDAARRLVEVGGAVMVKDEREFEAELEKLLAEPELRKRMGEAARALVQRQQGATLLTLNVIDSVIPSTALSRAA
ncbi:MAG: 3-deoxy-D-manno-octulosonic acid transferase [Planctomycetia bacterium]|nr:3-deoxy-D-manno-octulosonic acid transferase [Planctomycetia bacterium]